MTTACSSIIARGGQNLKLGQAHGTANKLHSSQICTPPTRVTQLRRCPATPIQPRRHSARVRWRIAQSPVLGPVALWSLDMVTRHLHLAVTVGQFMIIPITRATTMADDGQCFKLNAHTSLAHFTSLYIKANVKLLRQLRQEWPRVVVSKNGYPRLPDLAHNVTAGGEHGQTQGG
ncbi:hypothetical protein RRG08_038642 [Elysia crispata]|uniref:Uncharacterized protein n=1 Tax=Elysia crispata TaxID=231223 RepID=A0AAE1D0J7_9GAST|nr:hypothetical protein RRG08_038642 [Elysia crispata]